MMKLRGTAILLRVRGPYQNLLVLKFSMTSCWFGADERKFTGRRTGTAI